MIAATRYIPSLFDQLECQYYCAHDSLVWQRLELCFRANVDL
jgi:hypothetical protein